MNCKLPARHWLMLVLTLRLVSLVATSVDLKLQVHADFFFLTGRSRVSADQKIDKIFPSGSQLIMNVAAPRIPSELYLGKLAKSTRQLHRSKA